jgi:pimeloyl-ACP methyl ester carboxylesterase
MSPALLPLAFEHRAGTLRYGIHGEGEPLVLVHGTPWSSFNWRHVIPLLARRWRVHCYDLLGYGQSEMRDGQDVSLGVQNGLLCDWLDHCGLVSPAIVGHDFGGTTVLRAHLLDGRDFAKLVLIDPVAVAPWGSPFFNHVRRHREAFDGLPPYIHEAIVAAYVRGAMHRPMPADTLAGIVAPWLGDAGQRAFYRQIAQADPRLTDEIAPLYAQLRATTLIVWGEQDRWIPIAQGERLCAAMPSARWQPIAEAGHLVQEDQAEALARVLIDFLGEGRDGGS